MPSIMNRGKTRPTLSELKEMPVGLLRKEIAQLCVDAAIADHTEVLADAEMLGMDPDPSPERIVELWSLLRGESGSTPYESPSDNEPSQDIRERPINQVCPRCGAIGHRGYGLICTCI
jgi:hypothetical protein